jgi:hypothetical protein
MWEYLMETEPPAYNDQISTTLGGAILGEAMHRISQMMLWKRGAWWRKGLAAVLSPASAFNRHVLGNRGLTEPPPHFETLRVGFNTFVEEEVRDHRSKVRLANHLHLAVAVSYGLPGDPRFTPRRPMDHLDVVAEVDVSEGQVFASLFMRGLIKGKGYGNNRLRGVWGLFGSYDYFAPERVRVGAISLGVGTSAQLRVGHRGFVQTTVLYSAVPFGAAGTRNPEATRSYHWGPGVSQLAEVRLGRANIGMLKWTNRGFAIFSDTGVDVIGHTTFTGLLRITGRHAIGVDLIGTYREATLSGPDTVLTDKGSQARFFYAFLSDTRFGAVLPN